MKNKTFKKRDKSHCKIQKLIVLFVADLEAKKIARNPKLYDEKTTYYKIEAIKEIRDRFLHEFKDYGI